MSKSTKDKNKGIAGLLLLFGWLLFILLVLLFYFYYKDDIPFFNRGDRGTEAAVNSSADENKTYSYQTNANLDINALMVEYYAALAVCDQAKLQTLVTDTSKFDDMSTYERKARAVTRYSNINCYTLPGYTEDATLVYVICNISIKDVASTPLNIEWFYVVNTDTGYKIDNRTLDTAVMDYINQQTSSEDIQGLGKTVKDDIDRCIQNDPAFAEFYNEINTYEE